MNSELSDKEFEALLTIINDTKILDIKTYEHKDLMYVFKKAEKFMLSKNLSSHYLPALVKKGFLQQTKRPAKRGKGFVFQYYIEFSTEAELNLFHEFVKRDKIEEFVLAAGTYMPGISGGLVELVKIELNLPDDEEVIIPPSSIEPYLQGKLFGDDKLTMEMYTKEVLKSFYVVDYCRTKSHILKEKLKKCLDMINNSSI